MNRKTANTCLRDMIHISIEIFKLLLNEINKKKQKLFYIYILQITVSSGGMLVQKLNVEDLQFEKGSFDGTMAYAQNKVLL